MTRHLLSAGLLLGMLALTPVAASAAPHDNTRYSSSVRGNVYARGNVYERDSFTGRDSFAFRARNSRESRNFFSRGLWFRGRGDRDDRRR